MDIHAELGNNIRCLAKDDNHAILQITDKSGEGTMNMYMPFDGVMLSFNDMHMSSCESGFVLGKDIEVICFDHCREGRNEMEICPGTFSILQEKQTRIDDRKYHKGHVEFPLNHFHGLSLCIEVKRAQEVLKKEFPVFSVDIMEIRKKFCNSGKPYILEEDEYLERLVSSLYYPPVNVKAEYYKIKVIELLLYFDSIDVRMADNRYSQVYGSTADKVRMVYEQITGNLSCHYTINELAAEYSISQTALKNSFKQVYGDSIYSFLRRYRINTAASMIIQNPDMNISQIAEKVGYDSAGKFSEAFKKIIGVSPVTYRNNKNYEEDSISEL